MFEVSRRLTIAVAVRDVLRPFITDRDHRSNIRAAAAVARQHFSDVDIAVHIVNPEQLEPTPARVEQLHVPDGFSISAFARDLAHPRELAVADDGTVYVMRCDAGDILALRDADGDGHADEVRTAQTTNATQSAGGR